MKTSDISLIYGFICIAINALAVFLSTLISHISVNLELLIILEPSFSENPIIFIFTNIVPFFIPGILCTVYATVLSNTKNIQQEKKLLVNMPFAYSLFGTSGWITGFIINLTLIFILKLQIIDLNFILEVTFLYTFLMIFTFMGSFFVLETINRKILLPKTIPDGHVSEIKGVIKPSITVIYFLLYISICLFPCFILSLHILSDAKENPNQNIKTLILMIIILILNLLLTIVISRFYSKPLLRLKDCAKKIANGEYNIKTGITTGDELGILSDTFNDMAVSLKEKEIIYDTFGKVVTPEIRNWLLQGNTNLGGETVCATILFCDIRGFTSISEQIKPEQVVLLLNKYFSTMEQCIVEHNGIINKYIGDAIMAIFGVPVPNENQALDAYKCSIDMKKRLIELNKELEAESLPPIKFGIGLHTGNVLAGNIGSNSRMEYTVIGDTVNVASRIESLCKEYNCDLLISETTAERIIAYDGNSSKLQSIGETQIRGRKTAISIFKG